jgi:uncharacterized flavoprotein (TIGR03862 family)
MSIVHIVGGGPAGLAAAEVLSSAGQSVTVHDHKPSLARKFLMAGRGGLNLTHAEPWDLFKTRYANAADWLSPALDAFSSEAMIAWAEGLGQPTFAAKGGRVFPKAMKASPLLRAWLARLTAQGVSFRLNSRWVGWSADGAVRFAGPTGTGTEERPAALILATGGASWPRLGSDGAALDILSSEGLATTPFHPANSGATILWSRQVLERFEGEPLKGLAVTVGRTRLRGDAVITGYGLEGSVIYALGPALREALAKDGQASLWLDLRPDETDAALVERIKATPSHQSLTNRLRKALSLSPAALSILREAGPAPAEPLALARRIKGVRLTVTGLQPLARAISSAGGARREALDARFMWCDRAGVFLAGEMLDWEAPTGGYLLQAAIATGRAAAKGCLDWLSDQPSSPDRLRLALSSSSA